MVKRTKYCPGGRSRGSSHSRVREVGPPFTSLSFKNRLIRQELIYMRVLKMTSPINGSDERPLSDEIMDLRSRKTTCVILPIILVLFSPITITFRRGIEEKLIIWFFFVQLELGFQPPSIYFQSFFFIYPPFLVASIAHMLVILGPYLLLGILSAWQLHRLSTRRSTPRRVLIVISLATAVWMSFYLMMIVTQFNTIGPLPLPIPPVVAILSRTHIMELTRRLDSLEKQDAGLV